MRQYEAINIISKAIIDDGLVDACYLKGSIARQEEDEFSDVDLYCLVSQDKVDKFINNRLTYLETYKPILYSEEVNFVGPQIVCIYEDGLHFDLYLQTKDNFSYKDKILIIYDPHKLLAEYKDEPLSLTISELGKIINEFSYTLIDLYQAYMRKDYLFSFKLVGYLHSIYTQVLRSFIDPSRSQIATKGFLKKLNENDRKAYLEITKLIKYETTLLAAKTLIVKMNDLLGHLTINIAEVVNFDFFLFAKKQIYSINEE